MWSDQVPSPEIRATHTANKSSSILVDNTMVTEK